MAVRIHGIGARDGLDICSSSPNDHILVKGAIAGERDETDLADRVEVYAPLPKIQVHST